MSAIQHSKTNMFDIRRFHTKIKVIVHSHLSSNAIYLSDDVVACQLSKNIKGPGQCSLTIVPRLNYLNLLYPNDYINVYFNIGDGNGWTRTFFGLIDRIEESYSVGDDGAPNTTYSLVATDFTKIFTKTEVYNNPHLAQRRDIQGTEFGAINIGGLFLMTKGLTAHGSPDTIVLNTIMVLLGFGSQFMVPTSYPIPSDTIRQARLERQRAALRMIQSNLRPEDYVATRDRVENEVRSDLSDILSQADQQSRIQALVNRYGIDPAQLNFDISSRSNYERLTGLMSEARLSRELNIPAGIGGPLDTFIAVDRTTRTANIPSVLDYLDLFSFVERECIDGYTATTSIWDNQGPIMSMLSTFSNECVNELYFDLRPRHKSDNVSKKQWTFDYFNSVATDNWDRSADDIKGNLIEPEGADDQVGIKYVPAVIMREYPFSTIESLTARDVPISITTQNNTGNTAADRTAENTINGVSTVGEIYLGAVFSDRPNEPGRHYILTRNINVEDNAQHAGPQNGRKILDVAVISEKEIKESRFGRSDEDLVNLFEMWSESVLQGQDARYFMQDLSPVITPVQIMRHGLRKRSITTTFNRWDRASVQNTAAPAQTNVTQVPSATAGDTSATAAGTTTVATGPQSTAEQNAQAIVNAGDTATTTSPTVTEQLQTSGGSAANPATTTTVSVPATASFSQSEGVWPVNLIVNNRPVRRILHPAGHFGYRNKSNTIGSSIPVEKFNPVSTGGAVNPNGTETPSTRWIFHNGVDIPAPQDTSVHAVKKGKVVIVGMAGMYKSYGNLVGILHEDNTMTIYAHLKSIEPKFYTPVITAVRNRLGTRYNETQIRQVRGLGVSPIVLGKVFGVRRGAAVMQAIDVVAGERIGTVGKTKNIDASGNVVDWTNTGAHLHFEHCSHFPTKKPSVTPNRNGDLPANSQYLNHTTLALYSYDPELVTGLNIRSFKHPSDRSTDTIEYETSSISEFEGNDTNDTTYESAESPANQAAQLEPDTASTPDGSETSGATTTEAQVDPYRSGVVAVQDGISGRQQLARWVILQDHWYQHNAEYLSGSITMRPAPEIRVGYRLDIPEKHMSFYVEGVAHSWTYPNAMTTALTVTRGQPNNPFPVYVHPGTDGFHPTPDQRKIKSRLGRFFLVPDPVAVTRSIAIRRMTNGSDEIVPTVPTTGRNLTDLPSNLSNEKYTDTTFLLRSSPELSQEEIQSTIGGTSSITVDHTTPSTNNIG